jgi:hypothetical protein
MSSASIRSNCEISSTDGAEARLKIPGCCPGVGSEVLTAVPPKATGGSPSLERLTRYADGRWQRNIRDFSGLTVY